MGLLYKAKEQHFFLTIEHADLAMLEAREALDLTAEVDAAIELCWEEFSQGLVHRMLERIKSIDYYLNSGQTRRQALNNEIGPYKCRMEICGAQMEKWKIEFIVFVVAFAVGLYIAYRASEKKRRSVTTIAQPTPKGYLAIVWARKPINILDAGSYSLGAHEQVLASYSAVGYLTAEERARMVDESLPVDAGRSPDFFVMLIEEERAGELSGRADMNARDQDALESIARRGDRSIAFCGLSREAAARYPFRQRG
jgi:hypothetical protein